MTEKHTEGPWKVRNSRDVFCGNKRVCKVNAAARVTVNMLADLKIAEANARLIAAAPTMHAYIKARAEAGDAEARNILESIND